MNIDLRKCIGKYLKTVFLEWFYMNDNPISIIRLYVQAESSFNITCSEEDVCIKEQNDNIAIKVSGEYAYKLVEQNIVWLHFSKIASIKYLVDLYDIKRGLIFIFDDNHNFVFYNKGYQYGDNVVFDIDLNIEILTYKLIDI